MELGLGESAVCRVIQRIENRLPDDERFHLPKRSERVQRSTADTPTVAVDATVTPIERHAQQQRRYYSGKQKEHTLKAQVHVDLKTIAQALSHPGRTLSQSAASIRLALQPDRGYP